MLDTYQPRDSWLHRSPAGAKVAALMICGTLVFLNESLGFLALSFAGALALYGSARFSLRIAWSQIRPALWFLAAIALAQGLLRDWTISLFVVSRFAILLLLAGLLTLTTRTSDMMDAIERALGWSRPLGLNPAKISLTFSLTLRFLPLLSDATRQVREAQKVRGLDRNLLALTIPVVVRTLRMADAISEAIDARGYDPSRRAGDSAERASRAT